MDQSSLDMTKMDYTRVKVDSREACPVHEPEPVTMFDGYKEYKVMIFPVIAVEDLVSLAYSGGEVSNGVGGTTRLESLRIEVADINIVSNKEKGSKSDLVMPFNKGAEITAGQTVKDRATSWQVIEGSEPEHQVQVVA